MNRIVILTLSMVLAVALLPMSAGICGQTQSPDPSAQKAADGETATEAAPATANSEDETRAALVNDQVITRAQLETELKAMAQRMAQGGQPLPEAQIDQLRGEVLNNMIDRELLYQEARQQEISADPEQVSERHAAIKARFSGEGDYEQNIKSMGLTDEGIKEMVNRAFVIEKLIETQATAGIEVTEEEKKEFYDKNPPLFQTPEQVQASHILIKLDEKADDQAREEALKAIKGVQEKVAAGEDFAELAKTHSQGPSGPKGGDLGFFGKGQMVKPFEDAAFALQPGEVSDIVETRFGYHLIKVADRREAATQPYETAAEKIGQYLTQQKSKQAYDDFLEGLRQKARIKKFI